VTTRYADHVLTGTTAARPAATSVPVGTLYASSTDGVVYQSSGTAWGTWLAAPTAGVPIGVVDVKGDLIAASGPDAVARLPVGSNNQVLTADSAQTLGVKWATPATAPGVAADTIWDSKGDLAAATGADTAAKLAAGTNGKVLTTDSAQTAGLKWQLTKDLEIKVIDDATVLTTGDGKIVFAVPASLNGTDLTAAHAFVTTVSSSGLPTVQLRNVTDSVDMLTTKISIDASEFTSYTAAAAPVVDTTHDDVATGDLIAVDVDVAGTGAKGLGVILTFTLP
jgi:hypothetical protein